MTTLTYQKAILRLHSRGWLPGYNADISYDGGMTWHASHMGSMPRAAWRRTARNQGWILREVRYGPSIRRI